MLTNVYMCMCMYSSAECEVDLSFLDLEFSHIHEEAFLVNLPL